ncbi:PDZ domain-containing protein [Weizmannia acidilactici]|uniref:PDZ domain-containing protein n=1 Tax=Weizmannia acidilactici TaxID=2607726 RepID=UPI0020A5652F|nr:PDZ domain-containing protein [Weizmannia acidilactici]
MLRLEQLWLTEILKSIGRFFLHPVFYYAIILALVAGAARVKRERNDFHIRIYSSFLELRDLFPAGLLAGLVLSAVSVAVGVAVPLTVLAAVAALTIVFSLAGNFRFLSPAFTIGIPILAFSAVKWLPAGVQEKIGSPSFGMLAGISVMTGLLLIAEGFLMLTSGAKNIPPKLRKSRRGLTVGAFSAKRLWLVPVVCFLPSGLISLPFSWWPVMGWGGHTFSLVLVPFLLGFQHQIQSTLPAPAVKRIGTQVIWAGVLTAAIGAAGIWLPYLPVSAAGFAVLARGWISIRHRIRENNASYYFTQQNDGIIVLSVIPGSKADKMGLVTGEIISKCNGQAVRNMDEFYRALQINPAYCKLEVIDTNGEVRFAQGALYEGEHYELGILTVENKMNLETDEAL